MTSRAGPRRPPPSSSPPVTRRSKQARRDPPPGDSDDGDDEGGGAAAADDADDGAAPAARADEAEDDDSDDDDDDDDDLPPGGGRARAGRGWLQDATEPPSDLATRKGAIAEIERELKRRGVSCGALPKELRHKQTVLAERLTALWYLTGDDKRVHKGDLPNLPSKEMCKHLSMAKLYELIHLREGHQVADSINRKRRVDILHGESYKPSARGADRHRREAEDADVAGASATGGAAAPAARGRSGRGRGGRGRGRGGRAGDATDDGAPAGAHLRTHANPYEAQTLEGAAGGHGGGAARQSRGRQRGARIAARDGASALTGAAAQAAMNQQTEQIAHSVFKMNTKVADKGEYVLLFVPEGSQVRVRCPSFVSPRDRS